MLIQTLCMPDDGNSAGPAGLRMEFVKTASKAWGAVGDMEKEEGCVKEFMEKYHEKRWEEFIKVSPP